MNEKVRLSDKFALFAEPWTPKIVGEVNDSYVLLAKLQGAFVWHQHPDEDELFLVIYGRLLLRLRDRDVALEAGEFFIVPRGVEHLPVADAGAEVLLLEPKTTRHTGDLVTDRTVTTYDRI